MVEKVEEEEAVGMRCCGVLGWVGGCIVARSNRLVFLYPLWVGRWVGGLTFTTSWRSFQMSLV